MRPLMILSLVALLAGACGKPDYDAVQYADPQIGSVHGRWFFYTPAAVPFGMAKLAPHTNAYNSFGSWQPCGYDDRHTSIEGFGHFHEFQVGGVVSMPVTGPLRTLPGSLEDPGSGYRSRFDKRTEQAEPGYYSVFLEDYGITAELTATTRVGYHRYTFPASDQARILFDVGHKQGESSDVTEACAALVNGSDVQGYVITYPEYVKFCDEGKRVKMFFYARISKEPRAWGTFTDSLVQEGASETKGVGNGMYLTYDTAEGEVIEMQVGVSYTSMENALLNLEEESRGVSFGEARRQARERWNAMLSRIRVEDDDTTNLKKFYTGMYHALLGRGISSDVNGAYPRNDGTIGQLPTGKNGALTHHYFNTDGMWGGFWNLSQLWMLAYPDHFREYLQANLDFYAETGWLHDGLAAGIHTNGVQTNFFGLLLASAFHCGLPFDDVNQAWEAAWKNETGYAGRPFGSGKYDLRFLVHNGYVPARDTLLSNGWIFNFGASHTLEYCFSSYAVAGMAKALGKEEEYRQLMRQAGGWKHLFDPETRYIRPKYEDGRFIEDFNPMQAWRGFQEGNAVQYSWYVPHDVAALIEATGPGLFNERLEKTFEEGRKTLFGGGKEIDSFSGLEKLYNHGNQPCLHQSWLFNYSGKPWLTQKWTRTICEEFYGTEPLHGYGYGQDEDQGQLGAWFVMAAMGLFDVQGHASAHPTFQFGSPLFRKVTLDLPEGKSLVIETVGNSSANCYVQSLTFNGQPVNQVWLTRQELMQGGWLRFTMGPEPNQEWGVEIPPPSMSTEMR
ncbi:MAG TPA: GH92 family glycosyl hydrolase [Prolixibacteraceae bacterium]|nr:GH92 family glycosyl hydrolase [Prolixibacteraceae bacterium]